jgi:hypothetical protein
MPEKRCQFGSSEANGRIYVIGGSFVPEGENKGKTSSLVEEYNPGFADEGKSVETTGKLPTKWGEIKSD